MELLRWSKVDRKRRNDLSYDDPEYVLGFDLDMDDLTKLVTTYNKCQLSRPEEDRLLNHVKTIISIVLFNPKINPSTSEFDELTDAMFLDCWNALHYIKENAKPYSYLYRAGYTCACRYFKTKIQKRQREEAINEHIWEQFELYKDSVTDHKVRCCNGYE